MGPAAMNAIAGAGRKLGPRCPQPSEAAALGRAARPQVDLRPAGPLHDLGARPRLSTHQDLDALLDLFADVGGRERLGLRRGLGDWWRWQHPTRERGGRETSAETP